MPLVFVMPDGSDEISGGNRYNATFLAALERCTQVVRMSVHEFATAALAPATYLVDSLNLDSAQQVVARRDEGQRFVLLAHHLPSLEPDLDLAAPSLVVEKEVLDQFDGYLATGAFTRDWLLVRLPGARVFCLEPPLSVVALARDFVPPLQAVMVCNLIPRKGVLSFLTELSTIPSAPTMSIEIIGRHDLDRDYARECVTCVAECAFLSKTVTLPGPVSYEEVHARYQAANLFLSASRMETFGIALQEARHHGVPILAVAGGNSENHLTPGETGEVVANPGELARALLRLASDPARHALYHRAAWAQRPKEGETWQLGAERFVRELAAWFPCV